MIQWLKSVTMHLLSGPPPRQADAVAKHRAEELRKRHERLERMAIEADVILRTDAPEGPVRGQ